MGAQGALVHKPGEGTTGWQVMVELCVCGLHRRCIQLLPYSTEWTVLAGLASDVNVGCLSYQRSDPPEGPDESHFHRVDFGAVWLWTKNQSGRGLTGGDRL